MSPSDRRSRGRAALHGTYKWTRRAATLVVLVVVAAVAAGVTFWAVGGELIARKASELASHKLFGPDTRLQLASVKGFPLSNMTLTGVRVEREGPDGWFPFLSAAKVEAAYDLWGILHGRYELSRLSARDLQVTLRSSPDRTFLLPGLKPGGNGGGHGIAFRIQNLTVHDGSLAVDLPWRRLTADSIEAKASVTIKGGGIDLALDRLYASLSDSLGRLRLEHGSLTTGDGLEVSELRGSWEETAFRLDAGPSGRATQLHVQLQDLPLPRLGRFLGQPALDRGRVERLRATVLLAPDSTIFRYSGGGRWDVWQADSVSGEGVLASRVLRLYRVNGVLNGTELAGVSLTLPLDGTGLGASGTFHGLDLEKLPIPALAGRTGVLGGSGSVSLDDRTDPAKGFTADLALDAGRVMEIPFRDALVRLRGKAGTWAVDTVKVDLERASLRGAGTVGEHALDLTLHYQGDLAPWRGILNQENLAGNGRLDLAVTGTRDAPQVRASGEVTGLSVAQVAAPRVELRRAEGTVAGRSRHLEIVFAAPNGLTLGSVPFSQGEGRVSVVGDSLIMRGLTLSRGDTTVTVVGGLTWVPAIRAQVDSVRVTLDGRRFWLGRPAEITYDGTVVATPGAMVETPRGFVELSGSYDVKAQRVDAAASIHALDPSVLFPPAEPPKVRVGAMSGDLKVHGTLPLLDGSGDLGLRAVEWDRGRLDSVTARFNVNGPRIEIQELAASVKGGRMSVSGAVTMPQPLYKVMEAAATGPELDPEAFALDLSASVDDVHLADWLGVLPRADRPAGTVNARARVGGTAGTPRIRLRAASGQLRWRGFTADSLVASASYAEGTVEVDTLRIWQAAKRVDLAGTLPLDLTLYPFAYRLPDRQMDLRVDASPGNLENLKLTPWVDEASGNLQAHVHLYGTPARPLAEGEVRVQNAKVKPKDRDEVLENGTATIKFDKDLVTIVEAHGNLGGGTVTASGTYRLHAQETESYELKANFDRAVVRGGGVYAARVSGTLTLKPIRAKDGRIYPYATGEIDAERVEYAGSLQPQDVGQFKPKPILYDVRISAPNRIYVVTEDVNVELGGEVTVHQDTDSQSILGELDILHGTYRLFLEQFRITAGTLTWNDPTTLLPEMDVTAQAVASGYTITVDLTGRADKPVLQFSAQSLETGQDAGLTQSDILQLLAVGTVGLSATDLGIKGVPGAQNEPGGNGGVEQGVLGAGASVLAGNLGGLLSNYTGLEIQFQGPVTQGQGTVTARKWLTPELSVAYSQGLSRYFDQDIALEYRLRQSLFLRGEMIRRQSTPTNPGATQEYNLDLKIRHDY